MGNCMNYTKKRCTLSNLSIYDSVSSVSSNERNVNKVDSSDSDPTLLLTPSNRFRWAMKALGFNADGSRRITKSELAEQLKAKEQREEDPLAELVVEMSRKMLFLSDINREKTPLNVVIFRNHYFSDFKGVILDDIELYDHKLDILNSHAFSAIGEPSSFEKIKFLMTKKVPPVKLLQVSPTKKRILEGFRNKFFDMENQDLDCRFDDSAMSPIPLMISASLTNKK